ncbi:MAG: HAD-IIIA family hydrolase [Enhydrobacter sp.]|nr:MAG: HAD-IIIA family hydrolase [Enhydrobacter sp.]
MTVTQAVCLVGGRGTRLGALTDNLPKPMLNVGGRPFLDYLLHEARRFGLKHMILLTGYRAGEFASYHGRQIGSLSIEVVVEPEAAGTGGALAYAADRLDRQFFLLNGDSFFDFNWLSLTDTAGARDWIVRAALAADVQGNRYGRVDIVDGRVRGFFPRGHSDLPINAGIYLVRRTLLDHVKQLPCSLENEILPQLAQQGLLAGHAVPGSFIDIGTPEDFTRAQELMPAYMRRPAVFLDRDGVLNRDDGYVHRADQVRWIDGAIDAVRWLNDSGYYVFVVTNQAGVARGYYPEEAVHDLHAWMQTQMQLQGAHVDAFEHCPYHPESMIERYRLASDRRKPKPGMILQLQRDWTTVPQRSFLIGDRDSDIEAAHAASIRGYRFPGGNLLDFVKRCALAPRRTGGDG